MDSGMDVQAESAVSPSGGDPMALRALAGDRNAERELCGLILPAIRAFAARRLRPASAEDFAHDALTLFIEALREGRIQDSSRLAAFALGICRNWVRHCARLFRATVSTGNFSISVLYSSTHFCELPARAYEAPRVR